jgi:hypothetical protein
MSDSVQIILGLIFLVGVFILTRFGIGWKMAKTARAIIRDLESKEAIGPFAAVHLPYAKQSPIRIGMRDYLSKALQYLVADGTVGMTGDGKYYLHNKPAENSGSESRARSSFE